MSKFSLLAIIMRRRREKETKRLIQDSLHTCKEYIVKQFKRPFFEYRKELLIYFSDRDMASSLQARIPVTIRKAEDKDTPQLKEFEKLWQKTDFPKWIQNDYVFYVALSGEEIVGYGCICPAREFTYEKKLISLLKLNGSDAWIADPFTHPAYRGNIIYPALSRLLMRNAKEKGFKRVFGTIRSHNNASRIAHKLIGAEEVGIVRKIKISPFRLTFLQWTKIN